MTQGERVKAVRTSLSLTMENFGQRIGVSKMTISRIESGERNLTEHMAKSICREFKTNYAWLVDELGEMFIEPDMEVMELVDQIMTGDNECHKELIELVARLNNDDIVAMQRIKSYWNKIAEKA